MTLDGPKVVNVYRDLIGVRHRLTNIVDSADGLTVDGIDGFQSVATYKREYLVPNANKVACV